MMTEVQATHITNRDPNRRRLVCELYPGILIVDGGGIATARTSGNGVDRMTSRAPSWSESPSPQDSAEMYEDSMHAAERPLPVPAIFGRRPNGRRGDRSRGYTHHDREHNERLLCELYPEILVLEGLDAYSVLTTGNAATSNNVRFVRCLPR